MKKTAAAVFFGVARSGWEEIESDPISLCSKSRRDRRGGPFFHAAEGVSLSRPTLASFYSYLHEPGAYLASTVPGVVPTIPDAVEAA